MNWPMEWEEVCLGLYEITTIKRIEIHHPEINRERRRKNFGLINARR